VGSREARRWTGESEEEYCLQLKLKEAF